MTPVGLSLFEAPAKGEESALSVQFRLLDGGTLKFDAHGRDREEAASCGENLTWGIVPH